MNEQEVSAHVAHIVTWVLASVLCQMINIFGIVTNSINIICFVKQGFSDSVNISLLALSVSDLGSLLTLTWICICLNPDFSTADLSFEPLEVSYLSSIVPHLSFTRISSCITAMITLERCLCVIAPLKIKTVITPRRTTAITILIFIIFYCSGTPSYAVYKIARKFSQFRNKTLVGLVATGDIERVGVISFTVNNVIIPISTFVIIVICTIILSIALQKQAKWRRSTISSKQIENVSIRNQKIGKMVVIISALFIICFTPICAGVLASVLVPEMSFGGKYLNISLCVATIGYTMESFNSSMNICIYYLMSSKYKNTLRSMCNNRKKCKKNVPIVF